MLYDLLLRGGRVIDPAQSLDGAYDVAIREGRIAAVLPSIAPSSARETIDVSGKLVLPGLIDTHAHVFQYVTGRFGLEADLCGVRSGVTTLVDQGGPSCMTLPAFREFVVQAKKSRVVVFLSAYLVGGMEGHFYPNLYRPDCIDVDAVGPVEVGVEMPLHPAHEVGREKHDHAAFLRLHHELAEGGQRHARRAALVDERRDAGAHAAKVGLEAEAAGDVLEHVRVRVDESGQHQLARDVDRLARARGRDRRQHRGDAALPDRDVVGAVEALGRVDDPAPAQ